MSCVFDYCFDVMKKDIDIVYVYIRKDICKCFDFVWFLEGSCI